MPPSATFPRTVVPDSTFALLREGYAFIGNRCRRYGVDAFRTRVMFSDVICMSGAAAAELFYSGGRFGRRGAMPVTTLKLLQDRGSVQLLEAEAHRHRKQMFMAMTNPDSIARLGALFVHEWRLQVLEWENADEIVLANELPHILTRAVCAWAGVPLEGDEAGRRTRELAAMVEAAGSLGLRNWRALLLRGRSERWARDLVVRTRNGELRPPPESALAVISAHRGLDGKPLDPESAAVELLNVLRPTVAVSNFIVFAALALHRHPQWRDIFAAGREELLEPFVQEVRRISPFFPFIGGRALMPLTYNGWHVPERQWVLLDLYGTCHDARLWQQPDLFLPERFRDQKPGMFNFVPQGGGDYLSSHRCPGEGITIGLMKQAVRLLSRELRSEVPNQDVSVPLSRIPALPNSGLILHNVRRAN